MRIMKNPTRVLYGDFWPSSDLHREENPSPLLRLPSLQIASRHRTSLDPAVPITLCYETPTMMAAERVHRVVM
jgi:hypothetical protein